MQINKIKVCNRFRNNIKDLSSLKRSIQEVGLLHPIVVDSENRLIAGYRRLKAFEELGFSEIPVTVVDLKDLREGEIQENVVRQDFTVSEMVAVKRYLEPQIKEENPVGRPPKNSSKLDKLSQRTDSLVASYVGVGKDTLRKAEAIVEAAEQQPQKYKSLLEKVDLDKISVNKAFHKIKKEKQRQDFLETLEPLTIEESDRFSLIQGRFQDAEIESESIDAIITDPPYGKEYLNLWSDLAEFAAKVLKPTGILVTYTGQSYLPEKLNALNECLTYFWIEARVYTKGQDRVIAGGHNLFSKWKPIVVFYKDKLVLPPFDADTQYDVFFSGEVANHNEHSWKQSQDSFNYLIKKYTFDNSLVCDPFAGTGTTLLAALKHNRRCIGIEENSETYKILEHNIAQTQGENTNG